MNIKKGIINKKNKFSNKKSKEDTSEVDESKEDTSEVDESKEDTSEVDEIDVSKFNKKQLIEHILYLENKLHKIIEQNNQLIDYIKNEVSKFKDATLYEIENKPENTKNEKTFVQIVNNEGKKVKVSLDQQIWGVYCSHCHRYIEKFTYPVARKMTSIINKYGCECGEIEYADIIHKFFAEFLIEVSKKNQVLKVQMFDDSFIKKLIDFY